MKFNLLFEIQGPKDANGDFDENLLYKQTLDQCALADEVGWDGVWFTEHHFLSGFCHSPCPEVIFGALSQRTKRIRIGFGVSILPYHHPVRIAERVAMVDQLTDGRVEFGTGRSNPYEQTGMGIDPRETRNLWDESITMIPQIWQSEEFSWEGKYWKVPPRRVLPKTYQKPHPPIWLACQQPESYKLAAEKGIGVLGSNPYAPGVLEQYVRTYHEEARASTPVGAFINDQWSNNVFGYCGEDNREARELCAQSMKTFFGPDKPYIQGRIGAYEELLEAWGGVPDHLKNEFTRWIRQSDSDVQARAVESGLELDTGPSAARAVMQQMDADTLCDRGVIIAGNPESCIESIRKYEEIGVDQIMMIMQTESVPHEKMMRSIELFGKYVFPAIRQEAAAKAAPAGTGSR